MLFMIVKLKIPKTLRWPLKGGLCLWHWSNYARDSGCFHTVAEITWLCGRGYIDCGHDVTLWESITYSFWLCYNEGLSVSREYSGYFEAIGYLYPLMFQFCLDFTFRLKIRVYSTPNANDALGA